MARCRTSGWDPPERAGWEFRVNEAHALGSLTWVGIPSGIANIPPTHESHYIGDSPFQRLVYVPGVWINIPKLAKDVLISNLVIHVYLLL